MRNFLNKYAKGVAFLWVAFVLLAQVYWGEAIVLLAGAHIALFFAAIKQNYMIDLNAYSLAVIRTSRNTLLLTILLLIVLYFSILHMGVKINKVQYMCYDIQGLSFIAKFFVETLNNDVRCSLISLVTIYFPLGVSSFSLLIFAQRVASSEFWAPVELSIFDVFPTYYNVVPDSQKVYSTNLLGLRVFSYLGGTILVFCAQLLLISLLVETFLDDSSMLQGSMNLLLFGAFSGAFSFYIYANGFRLFIVWRQVKKVGD